MRLALALAALAAGAIAAPAGAGTLVVSPDGPYRTVAAALEAARDGDTVEVRGGVHAGPLVVSKRVRLAGAGWPVLDGGGQGTVVTLAAAGAALEGFVVRGSGTSLGGEDSGVAVLAPQAVVQGNQLEDVLFGIRVEEASGTVVRGNAIAGKGELAMPRRGDLVKVWYSDDVVIEGNVIERGRDVVLWYSEHLTLRGNVIRDGRYGLHFMYCNGALVERNRLIENSVGAYLMYSDDLRFLANVVWANRGPSGFGLGLKDLNDVLVRENLVADNRVGVFVDNAPLDVASTVRYERNVFAYNDLALELMPSTRRSLFTQNSFVENGAPLAVSGGGRLEGNDWAAGGTGNYWSGYAGYDANGDGIGDVPYRDEQLFESLADREPLLRLFAYSPAAGALDLAARAFPLFAPKTRLVDPAPLVEPDVPAGLPALPEQGRGPLAPASGALVALALGVALWPRVRLRGARRRPGDGGTGAPVSVQGLTKRYGAAVAVDGLDLTVAAGEALALWGPNGAGKTTVLRCLLGILPCEGDVRVAGRDVRRDGKAGRRAVGFVPQELALHDDLTVTETAAFYGRLKQAPAGRAGALLERLGLAEHAEKRVGELSGGMKQKLSLALALLADPPVLLLDEPTASLDAASRREFLELLGGLKAEGRAIVFASHRPEEVAALADRVLALERGRAVALGTPGEVAPWLLRECVLRLSVNGQAERAVAVLAAGGFAATASGTGIEVRTAPGEKAAPIALLVREGIGVHDFELEE